MDHVQDRPEALAYRYLRTPAHEPGFPKQNALPVRRRSLYLRFMLQARVRPPKNRSTGNQATWLRLSRKRLIRSQASSMSAIDAA